MKLVFLSVLGGSTCSVNAEVADYGDPCSGTNKYIEVYYTCA